MESVKSNVELFAKKVNGLYSKTNSAKSFTLDVCKDPK